MHPVAVKTTAKEKITAREKTTAGEKDVAKEKAAEVEKTAAREKAAAKEKNYRKKKYSSKFHSMSGQTAIAFHLLREPSRQSRRKTPSPPLLLGDIRG